MQNINKVDFFSGSERFRNSYRLHGTLSEEKNIFLCRLTMANMPWGRAQCIPLFCDPGSERGTFQTRILERVAISSSGGIFLTQGSNPCLYTTPVFASKCFPTAPPGIP